MAIVQILEGLVLCRPTSDAGLWALVVIKRDYWLTNDFECKLYNTRYSVRVGRGEILDKERVTFSFDGAR